MAHLLVTGGCGFIGSHLVDSLIFDGHCVRVLDNLSTGRRENLNPGAELVVGDITDTSLVSGCMSDVDGCYHLAAISSVSRSIEAWHDTHRTNLSGTISILEAARRKETKRVPVVFASSAAVYGEALTMPLSETDYLMPVTPYGADKIGCELHGRVAATMFGVPTTALRFFNVYGPRQDPSSPYSGVISIFSQALASGQPLNVFGDGRQSRDFIYVSDVVRFLRCAMKECRKPDFNVFNACTGKSVTILQLVSILSEISGVKAEISYKSARNGDIRESIGNPSASAFALGVSAETFLSVGLKKLWQYDLGKRFSSAGHYRFDAIPDVPSKTHAPQKIEISNPS